MKKSIGNNPDGFVIRWGGEEFMLGFLMTKNETVAFIKKLADDIKSVVFKTRIARFKITMTFGIATRNENDVIHTLIVRADENLYKGKEEGRDRIIS